MAMTGSFPLPTFTGTQVNYYAVCVRKLWLFSHDIEMERENENVQLGKLLDRETYKREQKEIALDERVVLDWIELKENTDGTRTVHEVKKGRSVEAAHRLQMLYYLFYLRSKGIAARGQLDYPLLKKSETVELTLQSEGELRRALDDIEHIVESHEVPPRLDNHLMKVMFNCRPPDPMVSVTVRLCRAGASTRTYSYQYPVFLTFSSCLLSFHQIRRSMTYSLLKADS